MKVGDPFCPYKLFDGIFIPECVATCTEISPAAKLCVGRLFKFCGRENYCWPGVPAIAAITGVSERSVHSHLKELEDAGFIRIEQRGLQQTNKYTLLLHKLFLDALLQDGVADRTTSDPERQVPSDQERKISSDPTYSTEMNQREMNEEETDRQPSSTETTPPERVIGLWNTTRGLKALTGKERALLIEGGNFEGGEDQIREALSRFARWLKGALPTRSPVSVFLRDPKSWGTYRTIEKPELSGMETDQAFVEFRRVFPPDGVIESDWEKAWPEWQNLSTLDKAKAIAHAPTCEPAFMKRPRNYLRDKEFTRTPKPKPLSYLERLMRDA